MTQKQLFQVPATAELEKTNRPASLQHSVVLALQAPVAQDLREVIGIKTAATDLERVGDLARNIANSATRLAERPSIAPPTPLRALASELQSKWTDTLAPHTVGIFTGDYGVPGRAPAPGDHQPRAGLQ